MLKAEVAGGTSVGTALRVLLEDAELQQYRKSAQTNDALMMATICGRGQGLNAFLKSISPVEDAAQVGRPNPAAVGALR